MTETWKPVVRYEGLYEVSDQGRVRSLDRTEHCKDGLIRRRKGRTRIPAKNRYGYPIVGLCKDGKMKTKTIHRLVLEAFVGPCPDGLECLHKDGAPENNTIENLKWGSHSENTLDTVRHGRHRNTIKSHCPRGHDLSPQNTRKRRGHPGKRECLACNRAGAYLRRYPNPATTLQELSDKYYEKIIKGA